MEGGGKFQCRSQEMPERLPKFAGETNVAVRDDAPGDAMEANNFVEEKASGVGGIRRLLASNEVCHFTETVYHHQDSVHVPPGTGQTENKIDTDLLPRRIRD